MSRSLTLLLGTDHVLEIAELTNGLTGALISGAEVEATLLDAADEEVAGVTWPLTLSEDPATDGLYRAVLAAALEVSAGQRLTARIVATSGTLQRTWIIPVTARAGSIP